jgi:hypothetical protein
VIDSHAQHLDERVRKREEIEEEGCEAGTGKNIGKWGKK